MAPASLLTIVGIGPGDPALLTLEARAALAGAPEVWLRTSRHPTVPALPPGPRYHSFDDVYDTGASFDDVYATIVARVLQAAAGAPGAVYAVPGHPLFGEATVRALLDRAPAAGIDVRIVAGISFLDDVAARLGLDPLQDGLLVLDALSLVGRSRLLVPQRPAIIAQVYDARAASHAKLALLEVYPPAHAVRVVAGASVLDTTVERMDRDATFDHLTTLYVPPLARTDDVRSFEGLRAVVAQLRAPVGGCPWDLEQTHQTLKRYLLEEAYEALDALDGGEPRRMAEELGDLLMQVLLHAQVAEDNGEFVIEDVIGAIAEKLIRRHPHVFGETEVSGAQEVLRNWETLKQAERGDAPLLDAVPKAMPALAQAQSVQSRAAKAGLAPAPATPATLERALAGAIARATSAEALGDLLFGIVELAREHEIDAEEALRLAVRRFRAHVESAERAR